MRKFIIYSAVSLNGKIARKNGAVDWLDLIPNPEGTDYGYFKFYESIDTTIQGFNTYNQILNMDIEFPYKDKTNYVLTRKQTYVDDPDVKFLNNDIIPFLQTLKTQPGKDIWVVGGGQINSFLLNAGLIDEIILHLMPFILPNGIEIFEGIAKDSLLDLVEAKTYSSGVIELKYQVKK